MTNYELMLQNLKNDLLKMGLHHVNVDVICTSLNNQTRLNKNDYFELCPTDIFIDIALCWSDTNEGSEYWGDLYNEIHSYLCISGGSYILGSRTKECYSRKPLFIMKPVHNFNILD